MLARIFRFILNLFIFEAKGLEIIITIFSLNFFEAVRYTC